FRSVDEYWEAGCTQSGLSSGEGLIWAVRDPIEKREPVKEKNHVSGYQTLIVDAGVDDKRLLVEEAEFASILKVASREGNTLSAVIRNAWDTGRLRTLTKNSPARATDAHISIVGHITQEELCRYLDSTEADNGFANRFLWLCVRRSKCLPEGGQIQRENFAPIVRGLARALDFARKQERLTWDEEARRDWHTIYPELSKGKRGLIGAVTARAEAQVCRLALLYALLDESEFICEPHLAAALALWKYCDQSVTTIFGDRTGDAVGDRILIAIRSKKEVGITR